MRREHFRIFIGVSVIATHAACFFIILTRKADYFTANQRIDLGLLLLPISSAYFVAVVRSAIEEQGRTTLGRKVNLNYTIIVSTVTLLALGGLLFTVMGLQGDIELARRQILLFEIAFGTAFGLIASDLFGRIESAGQNKAE
jgi:hypothetical protein